MPELLLQRLADILDVTFGDHHATVPWTDVAPDATTGQRIYDDAVTYGKTLFEKTFTDASLWQALTALKVNERLVLMIDDPQVAAIPWEYLRDPEGRLLAARLTMVRSVSEADQHTDVGLALPLHIVAIPVSPVDDARILDTEGEWQRVLAAVKKQGKGLILTRVRPPTLDVLERALHSERTTLVHFMGHSDSRDGKGLLVFEEAHARSYLVEAADFADTLAATNIFLVVLNSCRSAVAWDWTAFGNIARGLVRAGIPYALGMQFVLPDPAALALSQALYDFLLQGRSIEEAVRRTRRTLEHDTSLHNASWLAGIPVLYTSLREQAAPPLKLADGQPIIQPDPERLQKTCDLTALPQAAHFVGRGKEIGKALDALLAHRPTDFVALHGLGGIGKTSLAHAVAERVSCYYEDRVLAYSFETFARLDGSEQRTIDESFADRFYNRLARFYELDPGQYPTTIELQQAILQRRGHTRSLLVLDNIETLIDSQKDHPVARTLATFISRLKEGAGALLLTSRMVPPADWGKYTVVEVPGLEDDAGTDLFLALLPADRRHLAPTAARLALSRRVQGHPLSIRLLAGRFADETATDLTTFLANIETELEVAEQTTPTSLEDPERQKTLYACMDYSVKRLTPEQRKVLDAVSLFQAPFPPEFATYMLNDEEQTPLHLQNLVRLGLLNGDTRTFKEGVLDLLELHPMLRWYIHYCQPEHDAALLERYGEVYKQLARRSYQPEGGYDQSSLMRYLVRQSLPDCEAALQYLPPASKGSLAYHLAQPYRRIGQNQRARTLCELALEIDQELGDIRGVAVTQSAMAGVLSEVGKPQEALSLYEQALRTHQQLGDIRGVAVTQHAMADVLRQLGKPQEALSLYEQSLRTSQQLGEIHGVAVTQANFSRLLLEQGEHRRALTMAWDAYTGLSQHGFSSDAQVMQQWLISIKGNVLGPEHFNALWAQVIAEPQPEWLDRVQASSSSAPTRISSEQLNMILADTITVMTTMPEKQAEWRETIEGALKQAQDGKLEHEAEFIAALLALLDGQAPSLPEDHLYAASLAAIQAGIARGEVQEEDELPFDAELIPRSIAALLGDPQQKMAHVQYLMEQASKTMDEGLKALLQVIQLALFSPDSRDSHALSQLGRDLEGVYRQAWEAIAASVEAEGVDPRLFEVIAGNTLAVLGPASSRRSEWRDKLVAMRNQATAQGDRNMVALLEAVIRLLDAGGDPAGLGEGLRGVYAGTWQAIVEGVSG